MADGMGGAYSDAFLATGAAGLAAPVPTGGAGVAGASTTAGGAGGNAPQTAGAGGSKADTGAAVGGAGGQAPTTGGAGGNTASAGADAAGAGGDAPTTGGAGGNATAGTGNGGNGGSIPLTPGAPGTSAGGTAGVRGKIGLNGPVASPVTAVQDLTTGATVVLPVTGMTKRLSASGGAVTGIILPAGLHDGQLLALFNTEATNSVTAAAAGTSRIADGASCVIAALRAVLLIWDATAGRWYRTG